VLVKQQVKYTLKKNEGQARAHYGAFWQNESIGRPLFYVTATGDNSFKAYENENNITRKGMDLDPQWQANYARQQLAKDFLWEAMPMVTVMIGRDITNMAVLAGADYRYLMPWECVGFSKNPNFLTEDIPPFSVKGFMEKVISCYGSVRQEVGMEGCLNPPTTLDALTTMSMIMGEEIFFLSLKQEPTLVLKRMEQLNQLYYQFYNEVYQILLQWGYGEGSSWFPVFAEGKFESVRCDIMYMVSPAMFRQFALPQLDQVCSSMDFSMFNLETVKMISFIDDLAQVPGLQGIYWNLEPWEKSIAKYLEPLKKIKKHKLVLALPCLTLADCILAVQELGCQGLLLELPHFSTSAEGEYWIKEIMRVC